MAPSLGEAVPLRNTFLILVVALVGAGVLILRVRRHNPSDVLNAIEYEERSRADSKGSTQQTGMEAEQFRTGA
jgi:hypothetical protein